MIRERFAYHAPRDLAAALETLDEADVTVLSGGTWVVPEMQQGRRDPGAVLDLRNLGWDGVRRVEDEIAIGPATTYATAAACADTPELLRTMAAGITGGAQIRNQGTIGGSACYGNPGSDVPAVLVALEAVLTIVARGSERRVPAGDFFRAAFEVALEPAELLSDIRIPLPSPDATYGYEKLKLVAGSWPIVTAAAVADAHGGIARLVIGGAQATPLLVTLRPDADAKEIREVVSEQVTDPWSDALADGEYRRTVAGTIAARAVAKARRTAGGAR